MEEKNQKRRKDVIRERIRRMRREYPTECRERDSRYICERVIAMEEYRNASRVFLYMALPGEVETGMILKDALAAGKQVYIPKVLEKGVMEFYQVTREDEWDVGSFGIREPLGVRGEEAERQGFLIVPGVAFDRSCYRIGFGGGYYDRYLTEAKKGAFVTAALAYEFQIVPELAPEEWDIPLDMVVTPGEIIRRSPCEQMN
ncbi:MAG: 5-formyltetrahydrofolate cyclo-ligase [Lachnospiraceae bacterium]|nr:5-formyltetrahydrofolate cyclo-ligase [Lachnospiraceae bacterium]